MKKFIILFLTLFLLINCKKEPQYLVKIEGKLISIDKKLNTQNNIETFIKPYKEKVDSEMNTPLSYTPIELNRIDGKLESSLGNLMADLCFEKANPIFQKRTNHTIDFTMLNFGGIRAGISKGNITMEHAFKLMPFENELVVVELSPKKINELVNYLVTERKAHPISKQLNLKITKSGYHFTINGKPFDNTKTYYVLTSDYLQNGGDNMNFFKNPLNLYKTDYKVRNAIIDYFKENDTIKVKLDGRFLSEI
jgi:5'-nucleotidase